MIDKLNLGSGKNYLPDHVNVDVDRNAEPDILADITQLEFQPRSFTQIFAKDIIEHISFVEGKKLIKKCYSWLKQNGTLTIHTPNLRFLATQLSVQDWHEPLRWLFGNDGVFKESVAEETFHKWCYTRESLRAILENVGFHILDLRDTCGNFGFLIVGLKR